MYSWSCRSKFRQYFLTTNYGYGCASADSLLSGSVNCDGPCDATTCTALVTEDAAVSADRHRSGLRPVSVPAAA
jgi:hypothetical protein